MTRLGGGERGIRTLDKVAPVPPFQGGDLNRSSSSPLIYWSCRRRIIADVPDKMNKLKSAFEKISIDLTFAFDLYEAPRF